jgi:hypothetical protein
MPRRRRFLFLCVAGVIVGLAVFLTMAWHVFFGLNPEHDPRHYVHLEANSQVNVENFRRIKVGMSVDDVNSIFGMPGTLMKCGQGECSWSWIDGDNRVYLSCGLRDDKVTCGGFYTADGECYGLARQP